MKRTRLGLALLMLALPAAHVRADGCPAGAEAGRRRPGNDDLFIFVDTSLSMGPTSFGSFAHGMMEPVKAVLHQLVDCYLKQGDFVLLATFDSEARINVANEIHSARDVATLHEQIAALEPSRARYWDRLSGGRRGSERAHGNGVAQIAGGSLHTDLGEMLALNKRVLERYSSPGNRQLVLLFTDGEHDPPEYSPYRGREVRLDEFFPQLEVARYKLGLVALPGGNGQVDRSIIELVDAWDPGRKRQLAGDVRVIKPEPGDPVGSLLEQVIRLLQLRIDLVAPRNVDLGEQVRPRIEQSFRIRNGTGIARTIRLSRAWFRSAGARAAVPLEVSPRQLALRPGETGTLEVRGALPDLPLGNVAGQVGFDFAGATAFSPAAVNVTGRRLAWMEKYGWVLTLAVVLMAALGLATLGLLRKPVWMLLLWSDGETRQVSSPKPIGIGQSLKFGARGMGGLEVDGPESRIGEVSRDSRARFSLAFDYRYLTVRDATTLGEPVPLTEGVPYPVPGTERETVALRHAYTRRRIDWLARALAPGAPPWPVGSAPTTASGEASAQDLGF